MHEFIPLSQLDDMASIQETVRVNRMALYENLAGTFLTPCEQPFASVAWLQIEHSLNSIELKQLLDQHGVFVLPGNHFFWHDRRQGDKFIRVALARDVGEPVPDYPILFHKTATSLIGHWQSIVLSRVSRQVDYEGELAVVIGHAGSTSRNRTRFLYVAGYTCANDVSANDLEIRTSQWASGKMLDTFCPLGPVLLTRDRLREPGTLRLKTTLNGQTMQQASTSDMVFSVPFLISYVSSLATLEPGDLLLTGTPAGIGCNRKPHVFLQPGDEVSVQIDGIGTLTNPVVAEGGR